MKFNIDQPVKVVRDNDWGASNPHIVGKIGVIKKIEEDFLQHKSYGILFSENVEGHDLNGGTTHTRGWFIEEDNLILVGEDSVSYTWPLDKKVDDFLTLVENLEKEGEYSRAQAVLYLINRIRVLETDISIIKNTLT